METSLPTVLFVCVHNAGRSQMAAAWLEHLAGGRVRVLSGGSLPAAEVNPAAVAAMAEVGLDISARVPQPWTDAAVRQADVVITMGCGDTCPFFPGKHYEDWEVADPAGRPLEEVRAVRDEIEVRVRDLIASLALAAS
jgi:protein-tyrosine-phosphatase